MPGMFAMTWLFGVEATMIAVTTDAARGVTDRFRSMPMARSAVVPAAASPTCSTPASAWPCCSPVGCWSAGGGTTSAADALAAVGLLLWLRFALLWVGIYLGLLVRNPEAVVAVQILVWPLGFLRNAFAPTATMPGWLGAVAEWNPLSATVAATRELFGNPGWGGASWADQHALLLAVVWPLLILAVFLPLAVHRWRRLSR